MGNYFPYAPLHWLTLLPAPCINEVNDWMVTDFNSVMIKRKPSYFHIKVGETNITFAFSIRNLGFVVTADKLSYN